MALSREDIEKIAKASADEITKRLHIGSTIRYAPYIHEAKRIGDKVIKKYSVATTDLIVYDAWEPSALMGPHATITSIDDKWYGRIGTKRPPPELEALPRMSEERFRAVGKWYEDQYEEAYELIVQAFPEAKAGKRGIGEITLHWSGS